LGPYEVGKSELARQIVRRFGAGGHYFNARKHADRENLAGAAGLVSNSAGRLIVIDEIHGFADALDLIHAEIDAARYEGKSIGQFLVLGSLSLEAERLVSNRLGTRARIFRLAPIDLSELPTSNGSHAGHAQTTMGDQLEDTTPITPSSSTISMETLWLRGGFPDSLLADSDDASFAWRQDYLSALYARGYAHLNPALAASSVRSFFERIAALQGEILDINNLPQVMRPCLPYFEDLGLIRQLRP
jgi:predicted AAA+ superfamily ATPase